MFTDEEFSTIDTWQLSEIRKGPDMVRKKVWERIKIIKHNNTCEICKNYGNIKFREHLVNENWNKLYTAEEFSMIETWQLSEIRKCPETVRKKSIRKNKNY